MPVSDFSALALDLHQAARRVNEIFNSHARRVPEMRGLTLLDIQYLQTIQAWNAEGRQDVIVRKLGEHFGIKYGSAVPSIEKMLKRGQIARENGGRNGLPLRLTELGEAVLAKYAGIEAAIDAECARTIPAYAALKHAGVK